jgi:hypothetical protein
VHSGSGIANHAFAITTDGKSFNGFTVTGIGPLKAGAIFYRALAVYLTPSSDYGDAYVALNQAGADLLGTTPLDPRTGAPSASAITAADLVELDEALQAVEMNTDGNCGATVPIFNTNAPNQCTPQVAIFLDDAEGGTNGWTVANAGGDTPFDWVLDSTLPAGRPGTAWFIDDLDNDCSGATDESGTHSLTSPVINIPADVFDPTLEFTHFITVEPQWDGGNVKISVNGGAFQLIPAGAFTHNTYNSSIRPDSTSPMAGEPAFTGADSNWGTSQAVLSALAGPGDAIRIRFEFGKDWCTGLDGWYIDDITVYACTTSCTEDEECNDGLFCNGVETCVGLMCQTTGNPCGLNEFCDEAADVCVPVVFSEDFENGNAQGWDLVAPGSTAPSGDWVIGDPVGTFDGGNPAQPENAFGGSNCAFTGQNSAIGTDDVDGGVVLMLSPNIDLAGVASAELSYARWFFNRDLGEDAEDYFRAEVSSNGGANWVELESIGTNQNANNWSVQTFDLGSFISLTGAVRLRFAASDGTETGNIIEAAVDDVRITVPPECVFDSDCDDNNVCNGVETCSNSACEAGEAAPCEDLNECTDDSCDPVLGCIFTDNSDPCDDGLFCTVDDVCFDGSCTGGGAPCPGELCNEDFDQCVPFGDGDFDDDNDHDLRDFAAFQNCFNQSPAGVCVDADFDASLAVNLNDYIAFEALFDGP